ncbi:MAG: D-alanyl-D-alanine carboxypeptidase, partial [Alphaproteobacteria bacterium]|nr:D-alanyl-D-alanine carboxypeptidase [Alphaproteobacteria bacterium]
MTLIRRWAIAVFCLGLFALPNLAAAKYAAIVVDADTGRVLHGANANTRNHPASLTKMMTLYMLFDAVESGRLKLDSPLKVSQRAAGMAPSKLGLRAGATISVEDAIQALITKSANDVAAVVAENLDKSEAQFAKSMTAKAHTLGMSRSTFKNASGLPNKAQFSSARDMA